MVAAHFDLRNCDILTACYPVMVFAYRLIGVPADCVGYVNAMVDFHGDLDCFIRLVFSK